MPGMVCLGGTVPESAASGGSLASNQQSCCSTNALPAPRPPNSRGWGLW